MYIYIYVGIRNFINSSSICCIPKLNPKGATSPLSEGQLPKYPPSECHLLPSCASSLDRIISISLIPGAPFIYCS